jgi:hypothetical protein
MLRRNALLAAAESRQLAPFLELLDRGCHPAERPHLGQAHLLPRAAWPVNRADWRMLQCNIDEFALTWGNIAEP